MYLERAAGRVLLTSGVLLGIAVNANGQIARADFEGMWSDPPATAIDYFCSGACTQAGIDYLNALLDDPANDERPYEELVAEATRHVQEEYIRPRLAPMVAAAFPLDPADDPGFLYCEPWGVARQLLSRHQIEFRHFEDRLELRYGEWDARRTVYLDGRAPPADLEPSLMGFSFGRYEGDALVIETIGVSANLTRWSARHSDQLQIVERYTRSDDGKRLFLTATYEDPINQTAPIEAKKIWGWAPDEQIYPYEDCERPTEYSRRNRQ